jgi:hypothetical protein
LQKGGLLYWHSSGFLANVSALKGKYQSPQGYIIYQGKCNLCLTIVSALPQSGCPYF